MERKNVKELAKHQKTGLKQMKARKKIGEIYQTYVMGNWWNR